MNRKGKGQEEEQKKQSGVENGEVNRKKRVRNSSVWVWV